MGQVNEERLVLVLTNEVRGCPCKFPAERCLVIHVLDDFHDLGVSQDGQIRALETLQGGPHVVGIRNPVVGIKALGGGEELGLITQVPFSKATRGIPGGLEGFGHGNFIRVETMMVTWKENNVPGTFFQAYTLRVTAGHQGRT